MTILSGHCRETSPEYYNDGTTIRGNHHVAWQYTLSGRGQLQNGFRDWNLLPGSLMVIPLPSPYIYYLPAEADHWEFVFLTMIGREAIRIGRAVENRWGPVLSLGEGSEALGLMRSMVRRLKSAEIRTPFDNSFETYRFCMRFLEEQLEKKEEPNKKPFSSLIDFLKEHLRRDVSVSEMAEVMRLSRSHFTKTFTQGTGMSPRLFLEDLRLKTAMSMLLESEKTVKETAIQSGIPDVNYFCRVFKKRYGISPGQYRKKELSDQTGAPRS